MKNRNLVISTFVLIGVLSSCVTMGKYEALQARNDQMDKQYAIAQNELTEMKNENSRLLGQAKQLKEDIVHLELLNEKLQQELLHQKREFEAMKEKYDTSVEDYLHQLTGKSKDLNSTKDLLTLKEKELNEKESSLEILQKEYQERNERLEELTRAFKEKEKELKMAIMEKDKEVDAIRKKVSDALVGFSDKGLKIEVKEGKVYVSMEDKLLFASGRWDVSKEGVLAIKELTKILEENKDIHVMVEGHTDNVAYNGRNEVKDNWDLSVMRSTAIVKTLLSSGKVDPNRIVASGRGEYAPKVKNDTKENRAVNRRTEIILTPKYTELLEILSK